MLAVLLVASSWRPASAASAAWWLTDGAPAGITIDFNLDGVLEPATNQSPLDVDSLASDAASFENF